MENVIGTAVDILLFYTLERYLFNRLVMGGLGKDPKETKMVIALWLLLEEIGHYVLIRTIFSYTDTTIETLYNETVLCLDYINPNSALPTDPDDTPFLASLLMNEPINSRFFHFNRTFIAIRVANTMERVCNVIFGENAAREVYDDRTLPYSGAVVQSSVTNVTNEASSSSVPPLLNQSSVTNVTNEASSSSVPPLLNQSSVTNVTNEASSSSVPPLLNPLARPYAPVPVEPTPQDQRSMFLTFSRGHPLTKEEIFDFFTLRWGRVVEDVLIEKAPTGEAPLYGRIVFKTASIIPLILNGQYKAKFEVNYRHLWARQDVAK